MTKYLSNFTKYIENKKSNDTLIVQPRMGFSNHDKMRDGLKAVKNADASTIGTITLDAYTRTGRHSEARNAIATGNELNGYPIIHHGVDITKNMLNGIVSENFPIQVRHGTPLPLEVFKTLVDIGIDSTEGGPISYCLPYSRVPLKKSVQNWKESVQLFSKTSLNGTLPHLESFGGCMLGQLCPPSLLIALGIIECLFFKENGIKSVSLSYAQGTNTAQDIQAIKALKQLANEYLSNTLWHVVVYTYMGVFPKTIAGALKLLRESVLLAVLTKSERLIVKTPLEAYRIPTIQENIASLEFTSFCAEEFKQNKSIYENDEEEYERIYLQAKLLIDLVLNNGKNISEGIYHCFKQGKIDVPYCLHSDNNNKSRCIIDEKGYLQWDLIGKIPFHKRDIKKFSLQKSNVNSTNFLNMLSYVQNKYDKVE